ncbi:MAG TPA: hypothetical protein DEQ02_01230 [Ruminococcaceae bacterium]|nr:hypothetical protein [Oscillospiraceae bacterium]
MNPPYKQAGSGEESPDEARRAARHEQGCTYADIAGAAFRILKPAGSFYICHRAERLPEIVAATERAGLYVKRLRMVHTRADSPSKLFLMEARKGVNPGMTAEPPLILYGADEKYSAEASEIYGFYGENKR